MPERAEVAVLPSARRPVLSSRMPPGQPPDRSILSSLRDARAALDALWVDQAALDKLTSIPALLAERLSGGRKIMLCGNGGSACDAMHFAEELTGRFRKDRPPLAAIACTDVGHISCTANDYGYDVVFSRWVQALGQAGDVLIVLSSSGDSTNIVRAVEAARDRKMTTIGLLGKDGGKLTSLGLLEHTMIVPGKTSDRIQELHMLVLHAWAEGIEKVMFPQNW